MFEALERIPLEEITARWARCRDLLEVSMPEAGGLFAFTKTNIYWLSGTLTQGVFWLPRQGDPVLFLRRGSERARLESPMANIVEFRSYRDIPRLAAEAGCPLSTVIAAEKGGLPWNLADSLQKNLSETAFLSGDGILARARGVKSAWELDKMRLCGARHHKALHELLPQRIRPGMNEREISLATWQVFFELGHMGHMRMNAFGEEIFLGHVSAGDSGNYPSAFDGPLGLRGEHPALPFMGYRGTIWKERQPLAVDCGFALEGYITDKTQVFWAGPESSITDEARRGHDFCVAVQEWLAENLRPGATPSELYLHCTDWAAREGLSEGFMALAPNTVKFVGHGIGLAVDGWPVIADGFDEPLEENQVVALEPKFGVPGLGMVGVENTFVVTPRGGECITGSDYSIICLE
ncbi:peptidase M24 [Desulfovibrio sp. X2]|uniref:M24 family metallopeptidase n=1 Tax=Desulfovibrio sp. X2 TaxID=941449 RepID=UPI0003589CB8|nr:Xaa-Pro peptidase family protein [Desulfovibrio sp. X2]EPR37460.1 peptidase M24 [Desulfovibrio sp. X2]